TLEFLIKTQKAKITIADKEGSPFHWAAETGCFSMIEKLYKHVPIAEISILNAQNHKGETALHKAAQNGDIKTIQALIKIQIDPNLQDDQGRTALHWAAESGYSELTKYLVVRDCSPFSKDKHRDSALSLAAQKG